MASIIESITGEYARYEALAEGALSQLTDDQLVAPAAATGRACGVGAAQRPRPIEA